MRHVIEQIPFQANLAACDTDIASDNSVVVFLAPRRAVFPRTPLRREHTITDIHLFWPIYWHPGNLNDARRVWKLKLPLLGMYWFTYQKVQSFAGSNTSEL